MLLCAVALLAARSFAQDATLTTDTKTLSGNGEVITLQATVSYPKTPGAIGWSLECPANWEFVSVSGANLPDIKPAEKSVGPLEFAFTTPPEKGASFMVSVRLPAGVTATKIQGKVIVRNDSKRIDLAPAAILLPRP